MKKCNSCNIEFNTSSKYCPLCQNILLGESKDLMFPKNIRYRTNTLILKILLFASIVILLTLGFIELMLSKTINITWYIGMGLLTNYIVIYFILKNHQNIFRLLSKYGFLLIFLLIIWYIFIDSKVITNYIIPSVCIYELLFNFIIGIILRKNYLVKYSDQILMNIFLLLLPMILVLLRQTSNNVMSYICCLLSIISLVGLFIFFFDSIREEFRKMFNIG